MKKAFTILFSVILFTSADAQKFQQEEGLYYEVPDSANLHNKDFFNLDNTIYKPHREFIFSYRIIKNGDTLLVRVNQPRDTKTQNWTFVKDSDADSLTIRYLGFKIQSGYGGLDNLFPDYSQTVIQQNYYSPYRTLLFDGSTGLIENSRNVWLHPFRGKYFSVTEFSPFPYIKLPFKAGTQWTWKLNNISERWSDARIITYQGKQNASYEYKITGRKKIRSGLGNKWCFVTEAEAKTSLGATKLTSFFNPQYGFMRLDYINIDGSVIQLTLVEIRTNTNDLIPK